MTDDLESLRQEIAQVRRDLEKITEMFGHMTGALAPMVIEYQKKRMQEVTDKDGVMYR